ncbi:MAG: GntR family transcriptional regulator [Phycisphaeraceae bacterium]|nr:GntR family transcriptional regulator [Phycisphaeraceae bacterium]
MIELKNISPQPGRPLYAVVKDALRSAIDAGHFAPGERLPSTKVLSDQMAVSLVTAHRALQELVTSGVLRRGQGKGTYVHEEYGRRQRPGLGYRFGLVFHAESSLADAYNGQIFEGVRREASDLGADLILLRYGEDWRNECHGYLFVNPYRDQLAKPPGGGKRGPGASDAPPIMVVGATFNMPGITCVDTDNLGLAAAAVNYFVELGHREIAFIGGGGVVSNDRDRLAGFLAASEAAGIKMRPDRIFRNSGWRLDEAQRASLEAVLAGPDRPTAVFAAGYHFALDTYGAGLNVGLSLPGDLSIVGVDDPPSASFLNPALTTFRQKLIEMGRAAVRGLLDRIERPDSPHPAVVSFSPEFVERLSCSAIGAGNKRSRQLGAQREH